MNISDPEQVLEAIIDHDTYYDIVITGPGLADNDIAVWVRKDALGSPGSECGSAESQGTNDATVPDHGGFVTETPSGSGEFHTSIHLLGVTDSTNPLLTDNTEADGTFYLCYSLKGTSLAAGYTYFPQIQLHTRHRPPPPRRWILKKNLDHTR